MRPEDVDSYLARIRVPRPSAPTAAALAALHRGHLLRVPFENLDIHRAVPIVLDIDALHDKIVRRRRGGFCYENNGLFGALLTELGFEVTLVSAFSLDSDGSRGPEFDHLRLLVTAQRRRWVADVGNGAGFLDPLPEHPGRYGEHRVRHDGQLWWTEHRSTEGEWRRGWAWTPVPRVLADFGPRCQAHQHDPGSHFVAHRLCVLPTERGRVSLIDGVLTEVVDGHRSERPVSPHEQAGLLAERFGLEPAAGGRLSPSR